MVNNFFTTQFQLFIIAIAVSFQPFNKENTIKMISTEPPTETNFIETNLCLKNKRI